jgi:hypothetical protein
VGAVLVLDDVKQIDNLRTTDLVNLAVSYHRVNEALQVAPPFAGRAELVSFPVEEVFADSLDRFLLRCRSLALLAQRIAALGDVTDDLFASRRASVSVRPFFKVMRRERLPTRYCTTNDL